MESVKKNVTVEQIIYKGNGYLKGDLEKYETEMPTSTTASYTLCSNWRILYNYMQIIQNHVQEEQQTGEGTCPANMVCCVYPE